MSNVTRDSLVQNQGNLHQAHVELSSTTSEVVRIQGPSSHFAEFLVLGPSGLHPNFQFVGQLLANWPWSTPGGGSEGGEIPPEDAGARVEPGEAAGGVESGPGPSWSSGNLARPHLLMEGLTGTSPFFLR